MDNQTPRLPELPRLRLCDEFIRASVQESQWELGEEQRCCTFSVSVANLGLNIDSEINVFFPGASFVDFCNYNTSRRRLYEEKQSAEQSAEQSEEQPAAMEDDLDISMSSTATDSWDSMDCKQDIKHDDQHSAGSFTRGMLLRGWLTLDADSFEAIAVEPHQDEVYLWRTPSLLPGVTDSWMANGVWLKEPLQKACRGSSGNANPPLANSFVEAQPGKVDEVQWQFDNRWIRAHIMRRDPTTGSVQLTVDLEFLDPVAQAPENFFDLADNPAQRQILANAQVAPAREGVMWLDSVLLQDEAAGLLTCIYQAARNIAAAEQAQHDGTIRETGLYRHGQDKITLQSGRFRPAEAAIYDALEAIQGSPLTKNALNSNLSEQIRKQLRQKIGYCCPADRWGRPYEDIDFQRLPTWFHVQSDSSVKIDGKIAGVYQSPESPDFSDQFSARIATLFAKLVPSIEVVYSYARFVSVAQRSTQHQGRCGNAKPYGAMLQLISLRDGAKHSPTADEIESIEGPARKFYTPHCEPLSADELPRFHGVWRPAIPSVKYSSLQVFVKVVTKDLAPGESYCTDWHMEGMTHEHIAVTCTCVLRRDPSITGGQILFKRAWDSDEAYELQTKLNSMGATYAIGLANSTWMRPIGAVDPVMGRTIVSPNCFKTKMTNMVNTSTTETAKVVMVVFYVVDPEYRIIAEASE